MRQFDVKKTQFTILDFLSWQRAGALDLHPRFQRRSVWRPGAKSFLLDTIVRGLPVPIIYLRQQVDLQRQQTIRAVVDGQQRLRTVFSYIDPACLSDFDEGRDSFTIKKTHNSELCDKPYKDLPKVLQEQILSYEFSTHVLPINIEDREILEMFSRLNATGVKLNDQELRNARFYGDFKTTAYALAFEQLDRWRQWAVFSDDLISRMQEVEMTSDLLMNIIGGLTGKSQGKLDAIYRDYDQNFKKKGEVARRFRSVMDEIDTVIGNEMGKTVYSSAVHFFNLFIYLYDTMYGLGSPLTKKSPGKLRQSLKLKLLKVSDEFKTQEVPDAVLDSIRRASADLGRRKTRLEHMKKRCNA